MRLFVTFTIPIETEEEISPEERNAEITHKTLARLVANLLGIENFKMYKVTAKIQEYKEKEQSEDSSSR